MSTVIRRALLVGALTALALAGPASATYLVEDPGNVDVAEARDVDGLQHVWLSRDNVGGVVILRADTVAYETIACDNGLEGAIETDFTGTGTPATFGFGKQQSWARASGTIAGFVTVSNYCTGAFEQYDTTRVVSLDLKGSKYTTTSSSRTTVKDPDGTVRVYTHKETSAIASGTFTIAATTIAASDAKITHEELKVRIR